jgi:hypothetical protein
MAVGGFSYAWDDAVARALNAERDNGSVLAALGIVISDVIVAVIVTAESYEGFSLIAGETR